MGSALIDRSSLEHFVGGVIARLVIFPNNFWLSFVVSFIIHLGVELVEHYKHPENGVILESNINHISDMWFFCAGWVVSQLFYNNIKKSRFYNNEIVYFILLAIFICGTTLEYIRELFPYNKLNGAFIIYNK